MQEYSKIGVFKLHLKALNIHLNVTSNQVPEA